MAEPALNASAAREAPIAERALRPFQEFAAKGSASGSLLVACTVVALGIANSPLATRYQELWGTYLTIGVGESAISETLHHWVNDGLMAVFFLLVGLEIKREVLVGELASVRRASLPLAAALGGMVVPALIYTAFNSGGAGARGWGIPMATDIAFALGILALLGSRVPVALKVFLAALAIVDDIGAVLVIALFYTADLQLYPLAWGALCLAVLIGCNRAGLRHPAPYAVVGVALWAAFLESGVHATVAGVLLAFTIPARTRINPQEFLSRGQRALDKFAAAGVGEANVLTSRAHQMALHTIEESAEAVQAPLQRLEHQLHGIVSFGIMPLFALANAGLPLTGTTAAITTPVAVGVICALVLGKPLGVTLFAWLATRSGLAERPTELGWGALHGAAWLGGIGFTMSIFIAGLAFDDPTQLARAKLGVLVASLFAGTVGWFLLRLGLRTR